MMNIPKNYLSKLHKNTHPGCLFLSMENLKFCNKHMPKRSLFSSIILQHLRVLVKQDYLAVFQLVNYETYISGKDENDDCFILIMSYI